MKLLAAIVRSYVFDTVYVFLSRCVYDILFTFECEWRALSLSLLLHHSLCHSLSSTLERSIHRVVYDTIYTNFKNTPYNAPQYRNEKEFEYFWYRFQF